MKTVVFACVHNAGRSQMAAAFFNRLADPGRTRAVSAGTNPAPQVHPEVVEAMREEGLDLSSARPQRLTHELAADACLLVTMGCGEECPAVPGVEQLDWPLRDPHGQGLGTVRAIRDEIRGRVAALLAERGWELSRPGAAGASHAMRPAREADLPALRALLLGAGLPAGDVDAQLLSGFIVLELDGRLVGTAGVERHGGCGLLRSVAVQATERRRGLGAALVADRLAWATAQGLGQVHLLTLDAAPFFERFGFRVETRDAVPEAVRASSQFTGGCCATATAMALDLR